MTKAEGIDLMKQYVDNAHPVSYKYRISCIDCAVQTEAMELVFRFYKNGLCTVLGLITNEH